MRALPHRSVDSPVFHHRPTAYRLLLGATAALLCVQAIAQPASAANPDAPTAALRYAPLPALAGIEQGQTDWQTAHRAVGAFPRGHADIVAWEARQRSAAASPAQDGHSAAPGRAHGHHLAPLAAPQHRPAESQP